MDLSRLATLLKDKASNAIDDYSQLSEAYPSVNKFGTALRNNISQLVPTQEDLNSPQKMGEWGLSAALNAPMGMMFVGPKSAGWDAVKAQEAEKLLNAGADPAQVWKEHLIGRMPSGHLFSEIDDSALKVRTKDFSNPYGSWGIDSNKNADFNEVQSLLDDGFSEQKIHKMTGWARPVGGDWIPPLDRPLEQKIIEHEPLSKLYDFHKLQTKGWNTDATNAHGSYDNTQNKIDIHALTDDNFNLQNKEGAKSVAAHELQHAIQNQEGWARGGSPKEFSNATPEMYAEKETALINKIASTDDPVQRGNLESALNMLRKSKDRYEGDPFQAYRRLTGEAQARATQDRMNMNMQQRRESYPLANGMFGGIPINELISKY